MTEPQAAPALAVVSSSAQVRVDRALAFLAGVAPGAEVLVIGPSRAALDELALRHARLPGATFGVHRKTLAGLSAEIAAPLLAAQGKTLATSLGLHAVAHDVVARALAEERIPRLARRPLGAPRSAAESPGFVTSLSETVLELRLAGIDPAQLARHGELAAEIASLYTDIERSLDARGLADRAAVLRAAAAAIGRSSWTRMPVLLLDVAIEHRLERAVIAALAGGAQRSLALVPEGDVRTCSSLRALGFRFDEPDPSKNAELDAFRARLFAEETAPVAKPGDAVRIMGAPGEGLEAVEIARCVLAEARRGVAFEDIAVAVPSRELYAGHLEAALARAKIPASFEGGTRRPHAAGRAFLLLLAVKLERGSGRRLAEYLATAELPRKAPSDPEVVTVGPLDPELGRFGEAPPPEAEQPETEADRPAERPSLRRWERLLGEAGVTLAGSGTSTAAYVARRLRSAREVLKDTLAAFPDDGAPARLRAMKDIDALDALGESLAPVLDALDALPERAPWRGMLDAAKRLASLGLRKPDLVLAALAEAEPLALGNEPVDLATVHDALAPRLSTIERPPPKSAYGRVLVTTTAGLRGRSRRIVFVPGLAERVFPERAYEDPLLLDETRALLDDELERQPERAAAERAKLLLACGAASERLYFSYPRIDVEADRARVPSLFGLEVSRAERGVLPDLDVFETHAGSHAGARLGWPAPTDPATAIDLVERELAFVHELLREPGSARGRARLLIVDHPHVHEALTTRWRRHHQRQRGRADGLMPTRASTRALLAFHRFGERAVSASALQAFSACPYRFFLHTIVGLASRTDPIPTERLDPATLGALHHQCQALLARRLAERGIAPSDPTRATEVDRIAREAVREVVEGARERLDPLLPAVFDRDVQALERDVVGALEAERAEPDGFVPLYAELGFGLERTGLDPKSEPAPARLRGGYHLRGAVDRVDRRADGEVRVTDFKTGRLPAEVRGFLATGRGKMNQPLLYALALEALAGRVLGPGDRVGQARFFFSTERAGFEVLSVAFDEDNKKRGLTVLATVDGAIERGVLLATPEKDACKTCDFLGICGPDEERRQTWKKSEDQAQRALDRDLATLRGMP